MTGLILLILFGAVAISWWQLLQGRERARAAAAVACRGHGLVLMDDTVVFEAVTLRPAGARRLFALVYRFDFAFNGVLQRGGKVWITPGFASTVMLRTEQGDLFEQY